MGKSDQMSNDFLFLNLFEKTKPNKEHCKVNDRKQTCGKPCGKTCGKVSIPREVAESRANALVERYGAPNCRLFFLKCIYHLPENTIQLIIESSMRSYVRNPVRYFTSAAKRELEKKGL